MGAFGVANVYVLANGEVDPNPVELPKLKEVVGVEVLVGKTKPELVVDAGVDVYPNPVEPPKLKFVDVVDGVDENPNPAEPPKVVEVVDGVEDAEVLVGKTKPEVVDGVDEDPNMLLCYFFLCLFSQLNLKQVHGRLKNSFLENSTTDIKEFELYEYRDS